jgi:hypothetical protein
MFECRYNKLSQYLVGKMYSQFAAVVSEQQLVE